MAIIMGYISMKIFSKKGVLGVNRSPSSPEQFFFFLKILRGIHIMFYDWIICIFFFRELLMSIFSLWSSSTWGVYGPHIYRPPKTTFSNNNNSITMKFNIEIACIQKIIVGYISFEKFSKKGVLGVKPASPPLLLFFLRLYEELNIFWLNIM